MSACEELVGRPRYQVMRSQMIAPIRPPKMTAKLTAESSIIPLPIVFATAVPNVNAATKLKNGAKATACPGESPRVETTVGIGFAASWKPLMKSNVSATAMIPMTVINITSAVLHDDVFEQVRHVFTEIGRAHV